MKAIDYPKTLIVLNDGREYLTAYPEAKIFALIDAARESGSCSVPIEVVGGRWILPYPDDVEVVIEFNDGKVSRLPDKVNYAASRRHQEFQGQTKAQGRGPVTSQ